MARMLALNGAGSVGQAATMAARSGSSGCVVATAPPPAPPTCEIARFSAESALASTPRGGSFATARQRWLSWGPTKAEVPVVTDNRKGRFSLVCTGSRESIEKYGKHPVFATFFAFFGCCLSNPGLNYESPALTAELRARRNTLRAASAKPSIAELAISGIFPQALLS